MIDPKELEADVRDFLADKEEHSTNEVIGAMLGLYDGMSQTQLWRALERLSKYELADCVRRGEPRLRKIFGKVKTIKPLVWKAGVGQRKERPASGQITCPHCGGIIQG